MNLPAWGWMWVVATFLWVGVKAMSWHRAGGLGKILPLFWLWVGMDARAFSRDPVTRPEEKAQTKIPWWILSAAIGAGLLWRAAFVPMHPVLVGWAGVTGMLLLLHFGIFHGLALAWNRFGFPVTLIMNAPWASRDLGDFWGARWNRGFSDWARFAVFKPLARPLGMAGATLAGFFASGLVHELVISVPARGGWGLPTLYFLIQGIGVLAGRALGLRKGWGGRLWTYLFVLLPAPILFHPPFLERVFVPMLEFLSNLI